MGADIFRFKQFVVNQQHSAMRVGTDGMVLGSWTKVRGDEQRILDIGCGTGLLALMIAQRSPAVQIDAVEIEPLAACEAARNAADSPWADRLKVYQTSIQEYAPDVKYDLIVSNPPYFINSPQNEKLVRAAARHALLLPYDDLLNAVIRLMSPDGRFVAIFPYSEANIFIAKAAVARLHCNRKLNVYPVEHRPMKRIAAEFSFIKDTLIEENLTIETECKGEYTAKYRELTSPFYIRF